MLFDAVDLAAFYPTWTFGISPRLFPALACVVPQQDGTIIKAWGQIACLRNDRAVVVLKSIK